MKLSEWARNKGICYMTAYNMFKNGKLNDIAEQLPTGTIIINEKQNKRNDGITNVALYSRVSTQQQKEDGERQLSRLTTYATNKGYNITKSDIEIASGLTDNRKKLNKLLTDDNIDKIIVEHKDRFCRFGFNQIKLLLEKQGKEIEVVNESEDNDQDITEDLISIITSFCSKIYGQRKGKRKALDIKENIIE